MLTIYVIPEWFLLLAASSSHCSRMPGSVVAQGRHPRCSPLYAWRGSGWIRFRPTNGLWQTWWRSWMKGVELRMNRIKSELICRAVRLRHSPRDGGRRPCIATGSVS